ncbi:ATP-binding cassette sub-family B member 6-like [Sitodiplosis mosellana]|uniref:ATP-binding cassette sub-family B member 6-like n=1 Tax=Sitodiplosis mosellana TaxID=263140 RepID=UPI0024448EAB|nr:ATP-binding cassette sub-family B member 6-like [Sitodiplosis mosellana]
MVIISHSTSLNMDIFNNISHCPPKPPNIMVHDYWSNGLVNIWISSLLAAFIVTFGSIQFIGYYKYGTPIVDSTKIPSSKLYYLQMCLLTLIPSLSAMNLFPDPHSYGYTIFTTTLMCLSFLISILLVLKDRFYSMPSNTKRGHGVVLLTFWLLMVINETVSIFTSKKGQWPALMPRYVCSLLVLALGFLAPGIASNHSNDDAYFKDDESKKTELVWADAWKNMRMLLPFVWPKRDLDIQLRILICVLILIVERFITLLVPIFNQRIVDSLGEKVFCWDLILVYVGFKFLNGGFLENIRYYLWLYVEQFMNREIEVELFSRLHHLSLRWHLSRKTGEVIKVLDRSAQSATGLITYVLFRIAPVFTDIFASIVFLSITFNWYFGLIAVVTMAIYMWLTILVTEWGKKYQRQKNSSIHEQKTRSVDSLLNFETVKYYGAEKHEVNVFREAISKYQNEARNEDMVYNALDSIQNLIIYSSLLIGSLLCGYLVAQAGTLTPGQYVLFASYIIQLYEPLNWLSSIYTHIRKSLEDMEKMFDLLKEEQEVVDEPAAVELPSVEGKVEFTNVTFGYTPDRIILKNVSFTVLPGKTIALVGPSGSGKSTIIRLLFRFYDIHGGTICIDGHNIKDVRQDSLRKAIGVVPQDTVLFNNTIKHNIKYGRLNASDDDVISAAKAADVHDKIMNLTDKYETDVGERGLRLSGGEKQRVAIARTILKAPSIVLLDEATSALDTQTERNIQAALAKVCANRTTIIVAHRLSTIIHADEILVLKEGEIVERGRHDLLLNRKGIYADMWNKQLQNDDTDITSNVNSQTAQNR